MLNIKPIELFSSTSYDVYDDENFVMSFQNIDDAENYCLQNKFLTQKNNILKWKKIFEKSQAENYFKSFDFVDEESDAMPENKQKIKSLPLYHELTDERKRELHNLIIGSQYSDNANSSFNIVTKILNFHGIIK